MKKLLRDSSITENRGISVQYDSWFTYSIWNLVGFIISAIIIIYWLNSRGKLREITPNEDKTIPLRDFMPYVLIIVIPALVGILVDTIANVITTPNQFDQIIFDGFIDLSLGVIMIGIFALCCIVFNNCIIKDPWDYIESHSSSKPTDKGY